MTPYQNLEFALNSLVDNQSNVYLDSDAESLWLEFEATQNCKIQGAAEGEREWGNFAVLQKGRRSDLVVPVLSAAKNYTELGFPSFRRLDNLFFLLAASSRPPYSHVPRTQGSLPAMAFGEN